jgi:hypothetical protein
MGMGDELRELHLGTSLRTLARLEGLTDDEFRWEPAPGSWTVRRLRSGAVVVDNNQYQLGTPPFTTIAWRIAHLVEVYGSPRNSRWLRIDPPPTPPMQEWPWPIGWTAEESVAILRTAIDHYTSLLEAIDDETWASKLGPIAGQYAEATLSGFALHQLDEAIHHGAEAAVLRDLYRARREPPEEPATVGDAARAGRWDLVEALTLDGQAVTGPAPTALHFAAANGDTEMVRLLLDHGADPTVTDPTWAATPLGWAEFFGRTEVCDHLRPLT